MTDIKTEYYFSKTAIILTAILLIVISFLFISALYFLYTAGLEISTLICFFIFLLFTTVFPTFYRRINFFWTKTPALVLTKDQLIDNINSQKFKWTDIKNVSSASIKIKTRVNYIAVSLIEPNKYIETIKSPYRRLIARLNEGYFGGAFSIQPNIIRCDNEVLLNNLIAFYNEANNQNSG